MARLGGDGATHRPKRQLSLVELAADEAVLPSSCLLRDSARVTSERTGHGARGSLRSPARRGDLDAARLDFFIAHLAGQARVLGTPLWVGEWGIMRTRGNSSAYVRDHLDSFDRRLVSGCYWVVDPIDDGSWTIVGKNGVDHPIAAEVARPHPRAIAGTLARIAYDPATARLEVEWDEASPPLSPAVPTIVELPAKTYGARALDVDLSDPSGRWRSERDARTGRLLVFADPATKRHRLVVKPR